MKILFMKVLCCLFTLMLGFNQLTGQEVRFGTITHDGVERNYKIFIPSSYDGNTPYPLVFNFHGFGSNGGEQEFYSDMNRVGEANDFFICYPNGIDNSWNVGWEFGSEADDVGFTSVLIDQMSMDFSIDAERIYACGMSNGGFMSFRLACELNDRIAAIASVTGSMSPALAMDCEPGRPVSILQFHGTDDGTVPYVGLEDLNIGIDSLFNYWNIVNNCTTDPDTVEIDDTNINDGSTVQKISYTNCEFNTEVVLYKIDKGAHTWPGAFLELGVTNQDVEASEVIWEFFKDKSLSNQTTSSDDVLVDNEVNIFPNPATDYILVESDNDWKQYSIYNIDGELISSGTIDSGLHKVNTSSFPSGTYFIQVQYQNQLISKKFNIID